jgi:molecular chaperone GrpE
MSETKKGDDRETIPSEETADGEPRNVNVELEKELKQEHERAEDYLRRLQYLQAEFDNYRKRMEKEREEMSRAAADRLLVKLLEVFDELSIAVDVAKKADDKEVIVPGLEMVLKKLKALMANEGLKPIEAVGKEFDPNLHETVEPLDTADVGGRITEEIRKGFTLRGKVIRSSLVKVGAASKEAKKVESRGV